jgi:hypothetical protein
MLQKGSATIIGKISFKQIVAYHQHTHVGAGVYST